MSTTEEIAEFISDYVHKAFDNPNLNPPFGVVWHDLIQPLKVYVQSLREILKKQHIQSLKFKNYKHQVLYTFELGRNQLFGDCLYVIGTNTDGRLFNNRAVIFAHIR
jgi:hypothetical protein